MSFKFYTFNEITNLKRVNFIEIQYCKLKCSTSIIKKVSVNSIMHKQEDSLYILHSDVNEFEKTYYDIFKNGIYNNLKSGAVDIFGINYYTKKEVNNIIKLLKEKKIQDHEVLLEWLLKSLNYNGIYILGI